MTWIYFIENIYICMFFRNWSVTISYHLSQHAFCSLKWATHLSTKPDRFKSLLDNLQFFILINHMYYMHTGVIYISHILVMLLWVVSVYMYQVCMCHGNVFIKVFICTFILDILTCIIIYPWLVGSADQPNRRAEIHFLKHSCLSYPLYSILYTKSCCSYLQCSCGI